MRQYDSNNVQAAWTPIPGIVVDLKDGIAPGSFITEAKDAPRYTRKSTGTGKVVRVKNPNSKSGTLTLLVEQSSKLHQLLLGFVLADDLASNHVGPILVSDLNTGETIVFVNAFIETEPDFVRAAEASQDFSWMFGFEKRIVTAAPVDNNIVGS